MNSKINFFQTVAYFTSRLMFSLNRYAFNNNSFCCQDKKSLFRGVKLACTNVLPYIRAKGKVIILSAFTSSSEDRLLAENWSGRKEVQKSYKTKLLFSVLFIINNNYKKNWISNGIDIQNESAYTTEKEILFQPFSFYYLKDVKIDLKKYIFDIYLETVGKTEILEEKIRLGKEVEFIKDENIVKIAENKKIKKQKLKNKNKEIHKIIGPKKKKKRLTKRKKMK